MWDIWGESWSTNVDTWETFKLHNMFVEKCIQPPPQKKPPKTDENMKLKTAANPKLASFMELCTIDVDICE